MNGYYKGQVCGVDAEKGFVKVTFPEKGGIVSEPLPLLAFEVDTPEIGDWVGVVINSDRQGICLGRIFSNSQKPKRDIKYYKKAGTAEIESGNDFTVKFADGGYIKAENGEIIIKAKRVRILEDYND